MPRQINDLDKLICANFERLRKENHRTYETIANLMDLSFQQVQKYSKGTNRIPASRLFFLADYFGVPVEDFRKPIATKTES